MKDCIIKKKVRKGKTQKETHKRKTTKGKTQKVKHKRKNIKEKATKEKTILRGFYYLCLFL